MLNVIGLLLQMLRDLLMLPFRVLAAIFGMNVYAVICLACAIILFLVIISGTGIDGVLAGLQSR